MSDWSTRIPAPEDIGETAFRAIWDYLEECEYACKDNEEPFDPQTHLDDLLRHLQGLKQALAQETTDPTGTPGEMGESPLDPLPQLNHSTTESF